MKTSIIKTFKAWTRKKGTNDKFITTEVSASTKKQTKEKLLSFGLEITGEIYL